MEVARKCPTRPTRWGHATAFEWDRYDRLLSRTDPLGRTTRYTYDSAGNLVAMTRPDGSRASAE